MADGKVYLQHTAAQIDEGIDKAFAAAPQANTYTKAEVNLSLQNKVDKVSGKELSSNDFTDADLQKLNDVSSEVQEARGTYTSLDARLDDMSGGGGGTSDYTQLTNKPTINGVELNGDQTTASLGIKELTPSVDGENLIFSIS